MTDAVEVERDLEVLLKDEDRFEPPEEFVRQANFSDPAIYDEAEKDFESWWESWAKELDWFEPWQTVLEWNPPWAKWFQEGKLNASHNCLDRHVDAGKGDKVAYHWVGENGDDQRRELQRAAGHDQALRERAQVAWRGEGRRGRHLHADDPRDPRGDARLRPHRRAPTTWSSAASRLRPCASAWTSPRPRCSSPPTGRCGAASRSR